MIGFILGTSEGKEILSLMNKVTDDIVVSTATKYGGDLLKTYKTKYINSEPLDKDQFKELVKKYGLKVLVDASHPYAQEVSKTAISVCEDMGIYYVRYERKSFFEDIKSNKGIIKIQSYDELNEVLKNIDGNVLNTTGSNNIATIKNLNLKNRVIHRILPSVKVLEKIIKLGVSIEDIIAIKGPFGYELNKGIILEYNIRALITKDSGLEGGTKEKIEAALDNEVQVILLEKPKVCYGKIFNDIHSLVEFLIENINNFGG
ncbi:cobalt-precorrin-6A reductase [Clostridium paraputrificum]|uniref:cobalt-precorrin-6A reductase n=1 Tax=Clostridium TaxID=1485 RepID=UPI003D33FE27